MKERMQKTLSQVNGVKNYAAIVRISSEPVEISSEVVEISSELVLRISELLIISVFRKTLTQFRTRSFRLAMQTKANF